ncbi:sugar-transfer associated ATP-grasp domain-containing protein [Acidimangrovimonas sediminis]|uniref:sugar-transfer associated ATP-grasp domain-containing protein n=1 Tax=Acidimangrovimonas sediminis TaxID=2056283 RepID=UPI001304839F|nr:sugar-transfer associated ATP-grasp domain-containing protein [Acidimangrovimonas sediminis]
MIQTEVVADAKILTDRRTAKPPVIATLVRKAAEKAGVSPGHIFREIIRLVARRRGVTQQEYFGLHLYRSDLTLEEKRQFVGAKANWVLNQRMAPEGLTRMRGFLGDKAASTALWRQFGLPTTRTQALLSRERWFGETPVLRDAEGVAAFLRDTATYPLFGKPTDGTHALGSVWIDAIDRDSGMLSLGDGRCVPLVALAEEIVRDFPEGYLFQDVVEQHPEVTAIAGRGLSCLRIVTVIEDHAPKPLYAIWKIASPKAMSDNFWQHGSMIARLDATSGVIEKCYAGHGPDSHEIDTHPVSGLPIVGFRVPNWDRIVETVCNAHAVFPINGLIGWDVAIGPDGGVLVESNCNPGHEFYQMAHRKGILSPDIKARMDRVAARNEAIIAHKKATLYKLPE